jgi:hypothetical protein
MNAIIKSGATFVVQSRLVNNNFDLTLDSNINVVLEHNTRVNIGGVTYLTGPFNSEITIPPIHPNKNFMVAKDTLYHINNREMDPIGLTKKLEYAQKFTFYSQSEIILPSETILRTVNNTLEFRLTKATHCSLTD